MHLQATHELLKVAPTPLGEALADVLFLPLEIIIFERLSWKGDDVERSGTI
jgi:hypothetical protein